eukprot:CAMPEP_0117424832 /NCGR_PEP_ID=MMETSP0758-20121206/5189_1 /TAXON_ID=63605 /ORGANISM="Percolomonas cosmopolitus, Strain AE-1 (ATCC 50343)" /LENGTH=141 /DNA_ID=CAMNT_0005208881 /DNA_START=431 /DNA_END=856 /DNA_ORIENTATION=-
MGSFFNDDDDFFGGSMMSSMSNMMQQMQSMGPSSNGSYYSSTTTTTSSNGVTQTTHHMEDSRSGTKKSKIHRQIGDKAHTIEKTYNQDGTETETKHLSNIMEGDEEQDFENQWKNVQSRNHLGLEQPRRRKPSHKSIHYGK